MFDQQPRPRRHLDTSSFAKDHAEAVSVHVGEAPQLPHCMSRCISKHGDSESLENVNNHQQPSTTFNNHPQPPTTINDNKHMPQIHEQHHLQQVIVWIPNHSTCSHHSAKTKGNRRKLTTRTQWQLEFFVHFLRDNFELMQCFVW